MNTNQVDHSRIDKGNTRFYRKDGIYQTVIVYPNGDKEYFYATDYKLVKNLRNLDFKNKASVTIYLSSAILGFGNLFTCGTMPGAIWSKVFETDFNNTSTFFLYAFTVLAVVGILGSFILKWRSDKESFIKEKIKKEEMCSVCYEKYNESR
jgi:hypothetical protein